MSNKEIIEVAFQGLICRRPVQAENFKRRCHSKDPLYCPGCAKIHTRHTQMIIWSGLNRNRELSVQNVEIDANHDFYFVTLTAPSFGKVHRVNKSSSTPTPCACKKKHVATDACASTPINPSKYDYRGQILWNVWSNDLYKRTQERLMRRLPGTEMCSVRELQVRGVVHYHILIRVPKGVGKKKTMKEIRGMKTHSIVKDGETYTWGYQGFDAKQVKIDGENLSKTVWYLSKLVGYTTKNIGVSENLFEKPKLEFMQMLREVGKTVRCHRRNCEGEACKESAHEDLGIHGYQFTQTSGWSFFGYTYSSLQEAMRVRAEALAAESDDPEAFQKALDRDYNHLPIIARLEMEDIIGQENLQQVNPSRKAFSERWAQNWIS